MRIVTVGDNCMDVYLTNEKVYPGGNPVNVAVYLKELGAESSYIGWVGSDSFGDQMIQSIKGKGVDTSFISKKIGKTAVTNVELVNNDRHFGEYDEGVMAQFTLTDEELEFIQTQQLVHAGIWGHVEEYYPLFKQKGLLTAFDFSDQLEHDLVKKLPSYVDYSFFSYKKDDEYIRGFLKEVKTKGSKVTVATLGENGSLAFDGKHFYQFGVLEDHVVDTMGAGDSFIAGFLFGTLQGLSIQQCLELGTKTATKTIGYLGAW